MIPRRAALPSAEHAPLSLHHTAFHHAIGRRSEMRRQREAAGPADSGKSTVARQLLAYATRMEWTPTLVDMDLGAGMIGVPGSFGAALVDEPPPINGALPASSTLQYFYGSMDPDNNKELLQLLLGQLAMNVNARQGMQEHERCSGCVINTQATAQPGKGDAEYRFILAIVAALEIDVLVVLNQRLYRDLEAAFKTNPKVDVVMLKKSDGVPARSEEERALCLKQSIKDYFYGIPDGTLSPKRVVYGYVDLDIYQLGGGVAASSTMLPIGEESSVDQLELTPATKSKATLLHQLCAVSLAESLDEVKNSAVAGCKHHKQQLTDPTSRLFLTECWLSRTDVLISDVDDVRQTITLLCPTGGELPKNILVSNPHLSLTSSSPNPHLLL